MSGEDAQHGDVGIHGRVNSVNEDREAEQGMQNLKKMGHFDWLKPRTVKRGYDRKVWKALL